MEHASANEAPAPERRSWWRRWRVAITALLVILVLLRLCTRMYRIPTASMEGTVHVSDLVLVNELSYGPRWWGKRLPGLGKPQRNDLLVFNFPEGDTVVVNYPDLSYYQLLRMCGREELVQRSRLAIRGADGTLGTMPTGGLVVKSVADATPRLARCVGLPGDTITITDGLVYVNGVPAPLPPKGKYTYHFTLRTPFNAQALRERYGVGAEPSDIVDIDHAQLPLTAEEADRLAKLDNVIAMERQHKARGYYREGDGMFWPIFPNDPRYDWTEDESGPLWVPAAGATIALTPDDLPLYRRVIQAYEHNTVAVQGNTILINGVPADHYTFKQDYYWMMGDNRHRSLDSRFWGFVPFDHLIGKVGRVL